MARLKVGVLISGRGSNLQALLDAAGDPSFPAEIALVLSNKADAFGLERAARAGVATAVIDHRAFPKDKPGFEAAMTAALDGAGVELVCLAGFMRLLSPSFVERWHDRLINIHPSLLPSFKGLDTHERALAAGVRLHGCTVHFVRAEMDDGPIIVQAAVPVLPGDDAHSLADRVLGAEHRIYPLALRLIAEGRVTVEGQRATVTGHPLPDIPALVNPAP
ncbi:phosphoribosylglycinamide formyltransferase [Azospirillum sp. RWY-5-1]|uniref:Phosphoribosylglycinamide formyltransferase n=1 Tax=Azospirillum oleiclasticum TaxID=2735135 RepID=A0ABX2T2B9_9PROT|nr:phosphoribosylglycinamide formyltransferase [Azospirillum oleiclasticum]NYZ11208.1 phosphoribosylglycinamide formyltransferase [Azospirillum oleiclasticum]NYZ18369.1 phosphoribosylglycinamide formyltransferase [Azospirillum oleiclasticum]